MEVQFVQIQSLPQEVTTVMPNYFGYLFLNIKKSFYVNGLCCTVSIFAE